MIRWSAESDLAAVILFAGFCVFHSTDCAYVFSDDIKDPRFRDSVQNVADMEANIKGMITKSAESVAPWIEQFFNIKVSVGCDVAVQKFFRGTVEMGDWAIKLLDATGKPSAGILEGTAAALGDYDQCLEVEAPNKAMEASKSDKSKDALRGQYCMIKIDLPHVLRQAAIDYQSGNRSHSYLANTDTFLRNLVKIAPRADVADIRLGICWLSSCNKADIESQMSQFVGDQNKITVLRCETKEDLPVQVEQIVIMGILGVTAFLVLCGTLVDTVLRMMASGPVDDAFFKKQNMYIQFLVSFSLGNNLRKLAKLENDDNHLSCVRGIKFLSVCLVIIVSTYIMPIDLHFLKYRSAFNIYKFMDQWWFSVIANSSAGIDTLFFLAGLQITYRMWRKVTDNTGSKVSVNILKFLVVWYSRLTASQLLVIALFLMFPLIGRGPLWGDLVVPEVEHCKNTWWMNILYINNFWPANETCLYHTWFISSLMHLLIITPFILWILNRWKVFGILVILSLILGSCVAICIVTVANNLPPSPSVYFLSFLNLRFIWDKLFIQAYDHMAPFWVGILTGYVLARKPKVEFRKVTVIIGWSAAIACNLSILFGLYSHRQENTMESTLSAFYASAHRFAWALGIAWIVFACAIGYGGAVNDFLSWKVFIPLNRLSNLIYLLHPLVLFFHAGQVRDTMHLAHFDQVIYSSAYVFLTCLLAIPCYAVFVVPYKFLESKTCQSSGDDNGGHRHNAVSKVIAIKERITNDFNISMSDTPRQLISENGVSGMDNSAFRT